jgi:S1-C subfamily serine protease
VGNGQIATTAHVSGASDKDLVVVLPRGGNLDDYQDTTDSSVKTSDAKIAEYDPVKDISILSIHAQMIMPYALGNADEAAVGTEIFSLGFPHADHGRLVLTYHRGNVGARILLGAQGIKTKHIVLNAQARPGQSGSPVFNANGTRVVAMLIGSYAPGGGGGISLGGVDPHTLHQTTHAISAHYIAEMI